LYNKTIRTVNAKAVTYCNLFSLHTDDFHQVLDKYPDIKTKFEQIIEERKNRLLDSSVIKSISDEPIQNLVKPPKSSLKNVSVVSIVDNSEKF
jgi:hypothetical protein